MGIDAQKIAAYWSKSFSETSLEYDDLIQLSYLAFIGCQKHWKKLKGSFHTFFNCYLRNCFINLYNKEERRRKPLIFFDDTDADGSCTLFDLVPSSDWNPEDVVEYDDLIDFIEKHLDGLILKMFKLKLEVPLEFLEKTQSTKVNCRTMSKYFGLSQMEIAASNNCLHTKVLEIIKKYNNL